MKLRTSCVLCYLCVVSTLATPYPDPESNSSEETYQVTSEFTDSSTPRDKRALGLILSGLAQVFGYNVSPVQLATLPNPTLDQSGDQGTGQSPDDSSSRGPAIPSNSSRPGAAPASPKQRETIRFTGVLNFGNGTSLLNHLQQYENIFHGGGGNLPPTTNTTTQTPSSTPSIDPRTSGQPLLTPLLVNIPIPSLPQPPLPEIPPQDVRLSYPQPYIPVRVQGQVGARNRTTEKSMTHDTMIVTSPPPRVDVPQEPRWKKEYEERLAELERRQEEQAERLRQQERHRGVLKDDDYNGADRDGYRSREKQKGRVEDGGCRGKNEDYIANYSTEDEDPKGGYEDREKTRDYSDQKGSRGSEDDRYRDYERDEVYKPYKQDEQSLRANNSYSNVEYNEPLPISVDDDHRRPGELRNSYGQLLNSRELSDDGVANYFGKLKQSLSNFYSSPESPSSREVGKDEEEYVSNERTREDDPATNKYEEYSLEEDTRGNDEENSRDDPGDRYSNSIPANSENRTFDDRGSSERADYSRYVPLILPVQYLTAPEEPRRTRSRSTTIEKMDKVDNVAIGEAGKKLSVKESRKPKKENLRPKIGFPERRSSKKLHEGEQRELQMWPPPFDFILDSTIQTEVVTKRTEANGRGHTKAPQVVGHAIHADGSAQKHREDVHRRRFKDSPESRTVSSRQRTSTVRTNLSRGSRERSGAEDEQPRRGKEVPEFWERYKYSTDNYGKMEQSKMVHPTRQSSSSIYSKKIESLKRSTGEPVMGYYYADKYPAQVPGDGSQSTRDHQLATQVSFDGFVGAPDFFSYKGTYREGTSEKPSGMLNGNKKIENDEAMLSPQHGAYRYDASLTKFTSEPESKNEKVDAGYYANSATTVRILEQKQVDPQEPIAYMDFAHVL